MSRCHCHCGKRCMNRVMTLGITWEGLWCLLTKELESNVYVLRWCISTRNEEDIYFFFNSSFLCLNFPFLSPPFFSIPFRASFPVTKVNLPLPVPAQIAFRVWPIPISPFWCDCQNPFITLYLKTFLRRDSFTSAPPGSVLSSLLPHMNPVLLLFSSCFLIFLFIKLSLVSVDI